MSPSGKYHEPDPSTDPAQTSAADLEPQNPCTTDPSESPVAAPGDSTWFPRLTQEYVDKTMATLLPIFASQAQPGPGDIDYQRDDLVLSFTLTQGEPMTETKKKARPLAERSISLELSTELSAYVEQLGRRNPNVNLAQALRERVREAALQAAKDATTPAQVDKMYNALVNSLLRPAVPAVLAEEEAGS